MKKFTKAFICLFTVACLFGCGAKEVEENKNVNGNNDVKDVGGDELQKFVDENKAAVESLSGDLFKVELLARDNSIVYKYTYKQTYESDVLENMKKALETSIKNQEETFKAVLSQAQTLIPSVKSVFVEYYNGDGALISSTEFK